MNSFQNQNQNVDHIVMVMYQLDRDDFFKKYFGDTEHTIYLVGQATEKDFQKAMYCLIDEDGNLVTVEKFDQRYLSNLFIYYMANRIGQVDDSFYNNENLRKKLLNYSIMLNNTTVTTTDFIDRGCYCKN